jgi:hypothetical protein
MLELPSTVFVDTGSGNVGSDDTLPGFFTKDSPHRESRLALMQHDPCQSGINQKPLDFFTEICWEQKI